LPRSRQSAVTSAREPCDCIIPISEGLFTAEHVSDELGEVFAGTKPGRGSDDEVTIYQSCGIAVQDVAAAAMIYARARAQGLGLEVEL
jgi:alanine dehydrogenase